MATSYKNPPKFSAETPYENWVKELKLWSICSKVDKKEQGPAVALTLDGRAKAAVLEMEITDLNADDGLAKLITKLDGLFLKDENQRIYVAYEEFETYSRPADMSIDNFISDFERLYNKIKAYKIELPDPVLAYRVLKSANLSQTKVELVRATLTAMTYKEMLMQLRKLEDIVVIKQPEIKVKEESEDVLYGKEQFRRGRGGRPRGYRGGRGRGRVWKKNTNPTDESGAITKCFICKSPNHWARDCTGQSTNEQFNENYYEEEVHITLFTKGVNNEVSSGLLGETLGCAVLDSGCSRTVCSDKWLHCFIQTLDANEQNRVKYQDSRKRFRFGDSKLYNSMTTATIPVTIGDKKILMDTDVIDNEIPLLLSKPAMKQLSTKMDFENDQVSMLGNRIDLKFASSGHYIIPVNKKAKIAQSTDEEPISVFMANSEKIESATSTEKDKMCMKIHKQISHAHGNKLTKLVKDAGVKDQEFIEKIQSVQDRCNICIKYKKAPAKPIVCAPLAKQFNESVAMDMKDVNGRSMLHIIDHATRYSQACAMSSKTTQTIISAVLKHWIAQFGPPMQMLTDNGGEFASDDFREMGEKLNTKILTTAAESPWSNGINERHNGILGRMILKVIEDRQCSFEEAIVWAVSAKNSLANVYGYSPNQLVFGKNPAYPSALHDKLPALCPETKSEMLSNKLNVMHSARKAFVEAESDERLRRALRQKTRNFTSDIFQNGDSVFYKRENMPAWKGPGVVIGRDGTTVLVKHGSIYVRVHPSRLTHEYPETNSSVSSQTSTGTEKSTGAENKGRKEEVIKKPNSTTEVVQNIDESDCDDEAREAIQINNQKTCTNETVQNETTPEQIVIEQINSQNETTQNEPAPEQIVIEQSDSQNEPIQTGDQLPKIHKHVVAKMMNEECKQFKVLSRAGKVGSKHENWLNVHDKDEDRAMSINWKENVQEWREVEPEEVLVAYVASEDQMTAMFNEIQKWRTYDVFEEVKNEGQYAISTRWVFTLKDGVHKARLVARGFEDHENEERTDSPTCSKMNLRIIMIIAAAKRWRINSLDIQAAYLQGKFIERDIYLHPPTEANTDCLWKLKKCVYGLNEAARMWYLRLSKELADLGMKKSRYDEAIFFWHKEEKLQGVLAAHVDDFFWAGTHSFKDEVLQKLTETFRVSSEGKDNLKYLGIQVKQDGNKIVMNQDAYTKDLEPIIIESRNDTSRELLKEEKSKLKHVAGQLLWVASQSRPDAAFDACYLSNSTNKGTVADVIRANKAIRKLKMERKPLIFKRIDDIEGSTIAVFADASFKTLPGGASQGGFILLLTDKNGNACPLHWRSKKIKRVVKSSLAAECLALQEATETAYYLKTILAEILGVADNQIIIECYTDNKSLYDSLHSSKTLEEKRLILDEAILKEMMQKGEISSVQWIDSKFMIADPLTKGTASCQKLWEVLSVGNLQPLFSE